MNEQLEEVKNMIKRVVPKTQHACIDGCSLLIEAHCVRVQGACLIVPPNMGAFYLYPR